MLYSRILFIHPICNSLPLLIPNFQCFPHPPTLERHTFYISIISEIKKAEANIKILFIQILENIHMWNKMYTYQTKTSHLPSVWTLVHWFNLILRMKTSSSHRNHSHSVLLSLKVTVLLLIMLHVYLFSAMLCGMQDLSSPGRGGTHAPCSGSLES